MVGGAANNAPKDVQVQLGDLGVTFNGTDAFRKVTLTAPNGDSRSFELESGKNRTISSFGGHRIEQRDDQLIVDGQKVDFAKLTKPETNAGQRAQARTQFDEARFNDSIDRTQQQIAEGLARLDQSIEQALGQLQQAPSPQSAAMFAGVLRSAANDVRQALPKEGRAAKNLEGLAKDAEGLAQKASDPRAQAKLAQIGGKAHEELEGVGERLGVMNQEAKGIDKNSFDTYVQSVLAQMGVPPGAMAPPTHADINAAYDPRVAVPQGSPQYGGMQMDPRLFSDPRMMDPRMMQPGMQPGFQPPPPPLSTGGIVAPEPDISGMGKAALMGAAAALLLPGVGSFGYPTYGMGFGWPNSGLGMGSFNWNVW